MYYKDELLSKDISELADIAREIGADATISDQETLIYDILEKQAMAEAAKNPLGTKRKRTRILKKDTDHVYSVNGKDGENLDLKKNKVPAPAEQMPLFKELQKDNNQPGQMPENEAAPVADEPETIQEEDVNVKKEATAVLLPSRHKRKPRKMTFPNMRPSLSPFLPCRMTRNPWTAMCPKLNLHLATSVTTRPTATSSLSCSRR